MGKMAIIPDLFRKALRASPVLSLSYFSGKPPRPLSCQREKDSSSLEAAEAVIQELLAAPVDRLFFEVNEGSSILPRADLPFEESVAMAVESADPYVDFRRSMEEMVAARGRRDWAWLEELLQWYLKVNGNAAHYFIVNAFVDLLLDLSSSSSSCNSSSPSSSPSPSVSFDVDGEEDG